MLTASDPDLPEDELTFSVVLDPEHGALVGSGNTWTYTPADDYHGPDQFTYRVTDAAGLFSEAMIVITVTPVNDSPVAAEQELTTAEDTGLPIVLTASDPDLPEDELTFTVVLDPGTRRARWERKHVDLHAGRGLLRPRPVYLSRLPTRPVSIARP